MKSSSLVKSFFLLLGVSLIVGFGSCKKEDDTPNNNNNNQSDAFVTTAAKFSDPNTLPVPTQLQSASTEAYTAAATPKTQLQAYSSFFAVPANAEFSPGKTGPGTYTWSVPGGYSGVYTITDGGSRWNFTYEWTIQGSSYYNFSGWELKNGTEGYIELDIAQAGFALQIDWSENNNGAYDVDMRYVSSGSVVNRWVASYGSNGAGSASIYSDGVLTYSATWNANGSGTSTYYDDNGNVTSTTNF